MYICKFTYKKEDLDCKLCTEYRGKKHSCPHDVCPFIAERIEAGAVTYWDAVSALIPAQYRCSRRLPKLADEYPGTFFLDERHRSRMEFLNTQLGYVPGRNTPAYYATMYLLTSNEVIHWRMANCFCPNGLDFQYAILRGISTYNYALYRAALALSSDRQGVTMSELDDTELIEDEVFRLIINAMLIAKYGVSAMRLKKEADSIDACGCYDRRFQGVYRKDSEAAQPPLCTGKAGPVQRNAAIHGYPSGEEKGAGTLRKKNWKKLLIPNIPYLFIALFATKVGQALRLAPGADFSGKALHMMVGIRSAFASPMPSFHPTDLCVGICIAAAMRLAVYVKGKNAKKFRHNQEYGS